MLIYLLRHGLTAYNAEKRYQGQRDIPLSPAGRAQLRQADLRPETVYITPLCRTRQTAEVFRSGCAGPLPHWWTGPLPKGKRHWSFWPTAAPRWLPWSATPCPMRIITIGAPPTRAVTFWMQEIGRSSGCCTC